MCSDCRAAYEAIWSPAASSPADRLVPGHVKVIGENFTETSVVLVNGNGRPTTFISTTELAVHLKAADLAAPGSLQVAVFTPPPGA